MIRRGHGYEDGINPFRPGVGPDDVPGSMLRMDPPDHARVRGLVRRAFIPRNTQPRAWRCRDVPGGYAAALGWGSAWAAHTGR